ncbi:hypothetical protein BCR37DRAFT_394154 [Protomyces lactucae-debilis]|uniref:Oxidoreductase NAD-binding domain-containing protein 1 n=1 Tax=Protomyces lactucae-debilis TaxID=2754530 RepID=A0A1Y2F6B5_PROLT|nr:uncharacterized protein BCR37DRAFT_394154 [Protomyces lactucae-debilis]ORY79421.1 hypothetical protein BCR37DRAFT_394154 [Protomyces lactucae-debilis]
MATAASDAPTSHEQRTVQEPRAPAMQNALITGITQATQDVRLIDFTIQNPPGPFKFKAGQWVDTFTPASEQAGGFTIVSTPAQGLQGTFRLAVQKAERNPPAKWLWRPVDQLVNKQTVEVRVGGQFTFPPVNFRRLAGQVRGITLIAGGIGANPMMSILGALRDAKAPLRVTMLYGFKSADMALYLDDLDKFVKESDLKLRLFSSQSADTEGLPGAIYERRMTEEDLAKAVSEGKEDTLFYVCGPAKMTDWAQEFLLKEGVPKDMVQTERWW